MARTNPGAVALAIDTSLTDPQIAAFIDDASLWVTKRLAGLDEFDDAELEAIEKYLACHFVKLRDPRLKEGQFGDTRERFQRDEKVTEYLKAAIALDPTGTIEEAFVASDKGGRFQIVGGSGYVDDA